MNSNAISADASNTEKLDSVSETMGSPKESGKDSQTNDTPENHGNESVRWTISWKEALRREHEYRTKMEKLLLQFPDNFDLVPIKIQGPTQNLSRPELKRKAPLNPAFGDHTESANQRAVSQNQSGRMTKSLNLQGKQYAMQERNTQLMLRSRSDFTQQRNHCIMPCEVFSQGVATKLLKNYWCQICKVNCTSPENLRMHQQGKRHLNQLELIVQEKRKTAGCEIFFCKMCKVPCYGVVSMRQHLRGKKHHASIQMQHAGTSRNGETPVVKNDACETLTSDFDQTVGSEMSSKDAMSTVAAPPSASITQNQRLRTSSWPNYL